MANGNGKNPRENASFSIDIGLLTLLREYCRKRDRNQSDAINRAIKILLALDKAEDPLFCEEQYGDAKE